MREIVKANEPKYSHRGPISMDLIPIEDTCLAIEEFSHGSVSLCMCLRAMWQRNLKTYSCYADVTEPFDIAHITMEKNVDIFSYLSPVIIEDDMIQIDLDGDREVIRFAGNKAKIEAGILSLIRDIQSGRKRNSKEVKEKLGKPFPEEWMNKYDEYYHNDMGRMKRLA